LELRHHGFALALIESPTFGSQPAGRFPGWGIRWAAQWCRLREEIHAGADGGAFQKIMSAG